MYNTRKKSTANLILIDNLIVSPNTSTLSMANSADLITKSQGFCIEAVIDCLRTTNDGMINVECRRTNFNSYIQI